MLKRTKFVEQHRYLSDDLIIEEILTRLPVKSVLRFKSVSKQWYSTLSSPGFANAHLMKSPLSHPSAPVNTLFIESWNNYYLFSYDDDGDDRISGNFEDNLVKLDLEFGGYEKYKTELTGCSNGLICLTPKHGEDFVIWNPATRKRHKYKIDVYLPPHPYVCGFGYASSVDDYKYVRITIQTWGSDVHIFSLKKNKWRKIDFDHGHDALACYGQAVLINETLYWAAFNFQNTTYIVSFDLGIERFDRVKSDLSFLGNMGGCLSTCSDKPTFRNKLMHTVNLLAIGKSIDVPKGLRFSSLSQMIGFTRMGNFFVTTSPDQWSMAYPKELGIVDTGTKPIRYTELFRFDGLFNIARYVPSLVSPFLIEEPSET